MANYVTKYTPVQMKLLDQEPAVGVDLSTLSKGDSCDKAGGDGDSIAAAGCTSGIPYGGMAEMGRALGRGMVSTLPLVSKIRCPLLSLLVRHESLQSYTRYFALFLLC